MRNVPLQGSKAGWLVIWPLALLAVGPLRGQPAPLTHASQISSLSAAEAAKSRPVKIRGILTDFVREWNGFFLQDETGAVFVAHDPVRDGGPKTFQPGQILEVTGLTKAGSVHGDVAATGLKVVGTGPLPAPLDLSNTNLLKVENERLRVKGTGQVFSIGDEGGLTLMQLMTPSGLILGLLLEPNSFPEVQRLSGAAIEFEGVMGLNIKDGKWDPTQFNILVTGMEAIHKIEQVAITPIGQLAADGRLARIQARVEYVGPRSLLARDASGVVDVEYKGNRGNAGLRPGSAIEVIGYPVRLSSGMVIRNASVAVVAGEGPALWLLGTIAQVHGLSVSQAALGFPVQVRGVVTYSDPDKFLQFVQDDTAGVYVAPAGQSSDSLPRAGTSVEILGFSDPGDFAPIIKAQEVRVIGPGKFPKPAPAPYQLLMTGAEDSQWIELYGVVRSAAFISNHTLVALSIGDTVIQMTVLDSVRSAPSNFVGASIRASGACLSLFDEHRRLKGIELLVPGWDHVEIKEADVADPFQLPLSQISGLFQFRAGSNRLNRAHVQGRILLRQRGGALFLQDDSGGILVQAGGDIPAADCVEVVGFPGVKDQLPVLQDALVRSSAEAAPPPAPPVRLSPESALDESLNARLVTLEGRVLAHSTGTAEETATVQFARWTTDAILDKSGGAALPRFVPDSMVQFTGVYVAQMNNNRQIESFRLLLRSPADAVLITVPPWWTAQRMAWVFGGVGGVLMLSLGWVAALRQQVRRRTAQLREEIEERKRMEAQVKKTHRDLMDVSHQAGMAEVATNVLHNVGNVLNSVVVSSSVVTEKVRQSKLSNFTRIADMLREHESDLAGYLTKDPKGSKLPAYFTALAGSLTKEQNDVLQELSQLRGNVEHIADIVAMQQNYAKVYGLRESLSVAELVEDALRLDSEALARQRIQVRRDYQTVPPIEAEKHKLLQILVNLIQNAKNALMEGGSPEKRLTMRVGMSQGGLVRISVSDNGVGIAPENLTRVFAHGFTTRKDGHGFGLHSGALAASEMNGSLTAHSDGLGKGATFVLEFPAVPAASLQPVGC